MCRTPPSGAELRIAHLWSGEGQHYTIVFHLVWPREVWLGLGLGRDRLENLKAGTILQNAMGLIQGSVTDEICVGLCDDLWDCQDQMGDARRSEAPKAPLLFRPTARIRAPLTPCGQ